MDPREWTKIGATAMVRVVEVVEVVEVVRVVEVAEEVGIDILWCFRVPKANIFETSYQQSSVLTPSLHQRNLKTNNHLSDKLL
jgi:hypothetical protein